MNPRYILFVEHLIATNFNRTKAAKLAGYSPKTAYSQGNRLMKNVEVQKMIKARIRSLLSDTEKLTLEWLEEVKKVAFSDVRKALNDDGTPKNVSELDDSIAGAIESIGTTTISKSTDHGEEEKTITNIKLAPKVRGLELLGKYLAILNDEAPAADTKDDKQNKADTKDRLAYLLAKRDK